MTAQEILNLTRRDALSVFPRDDTQRRSAFMRLFSKWHPDVCDDPLATDVFAHLVDLRNMTVDSIRKQRFERSFETADGRRLRAAPLNVLTVDQGEIIVNKNTITTRFPEKYSKLAQQELEAIHLFRFADEEMRTQMEPFLPRILRTEDLEDGGLLVIVRKDPREFLLYDLLMHKGGMQAVHAAWLCSGLMNICAWLEYAGLVHGAISPKNILINPETHTVRLATGWAFATRAGGRPLVLPARTLSLMPRLSRRHETVDNGCDRELVRQTLREALGDRTGTNGAVFALPAEISAWVNGPPARTAVEDYALWRTALEKGWGRRRFVDYPVDVAEVYHGL